jgi:hypothetical protein
MISKIYPFTSRLLLAFTITTPALAEGYVAKCITESTKEVIKDLSLPEDKAKKIATDWCNCFKDGAVKSGKKDEYDELDAFYGTPDGKKLDKTCGEKVGWE